MTDTNPGENSLHDAESWSRNYPDNWKKYTRVYNSHYLIAMFVIVCLAMGQFLNSTFLLTLLHWLFYPLLLVWIPLGYHIDKWKCPRCGKRFFASGWDNAKSMILNPGFTDSIAGYFLRLPRRIFRVMECKDCSQDDMRAPASRCHHCGLPKH